MKTIDAIRARRSIRKYKPDAPVTQEQLDLLLEAAMLAPSACNTRPWEFIVVRDRKILNELTKIHTYAQMLSTAPLAIIVCALPKTQEKDISFGYYPQDCGAATQNILIQAVELGLGTCWCGVYPKENLMATVKELLNIDKDSIPFNIIAVGVPDEAPKARGSYDKNKVRYI